MRSATTSNSSTRRTRCNATPAKPRSPAARAKASSSSPPGWPATATSPTPYSSGPSASLRTSGWAREFYDTQRGRGKRHHAALRALGNRWLEVLWHCLTKNIPYDEARPRRQPQPGPRPNHRTDHTRCLTPGLTKGVSSGHHQIPILINGRGEAGVQGHGGAVLLDHRRALDCGAGPQVVAPVDGRLHVLVAVEAHRPVRSGWRPARRRGRAAAGRRIGPTPVTRRFTHSTCCSACRGSSSRTPRRARRGTRRPRRRAPGRSGRPDRHPDLERLPEYRRSAQRTKRAGSAGSLPRRAPRRPAGQASNCARPRRLRASRGGTTCGPHVVVLDVDGQQAERGQVAGVERHQHRADRQDVHQPARQQRARAAERDQREVAYVEPALGGDLAQRVGLVPRARSPGSRRRMPPGRAQLGAERGERRARPPRRPAGSRRRAGAAGSGRARHARRSPSARSPPRP